MYLELETGLTASELDPCLSMLESFVARRIITGEETKEYNKLFVEIIGSLKLAGPCQVHAALQKKLLSGGGTTRTWPTDNAVIEAAIRRPMFNSMRTPALRLILERLELRYRGKKSEEHTVAEGLQIEHVLPVKWPEHWPLGDKVIPANVAALANELGGAILMGHSESSGFPTQAALQPGSHSVKGIMRLETGCFGNLTTAEISTLSKIPIIIEYGDFSAVPQPANPCPAFIAAVNAAGGDVEFAWLPALTPNSLYKGSPGPLAGNDHMVMLDTNNQTIAQIFVDWASSRGL